MQLVCSTNNLIGAQAVQVNVRCLLQDSLAHQAEEQWQKQARAHRRMQKLQRDVRYVLQSHPYAAQLVLIQCTAKDTA